MQTIYQEVIVTNELPRIGSGYRLVKVQIGDRVELRGNIGKVIEVSDKSLTIYCGDRKGRVPYTLGVSKKVFGREGQIL
jgi:hypothetical protein